MIETASDRKAQYPWWAGNARLTNLSGTFLTAHIAHAAIVAFSIGALILLEINRYSPDRPMSEQGLFLLPRLATQGWSQVSDGQVTDTYPFFAFGVVLLVSAAVFTAGTLFHRSQVPASLEESKNPLARQYHFSWDDPKKLSFILGNHLIFLGIGALLLVAKAMFFGGLYDANIGQVRVVTEPTLSPGIIIDRIGHLFDVNNLEDVVGGHIYVGALLIVAGIWHMISEPWDWVKRRFLFSGNAILSYSLFSLALTGFAGSYFCGFNTLAYPVEFYGAPLSLKSSLLPHYFDPNQLEPTTRVWLANTYFYLSFFTLQGSLWHFGLASGYFEPVLQSWKAAFSEIRTTNLAYQRAFNHQPQPNWNTFYESPQVELQPAFAYQESAQKSLNYLYEPSSNSVASTRTKLQPNHRQVLYQFNYPNDAEKTFYESSSREGKSKLEYPSPMPQNLYETTYQKQKSSNLYGG